MKHAHGQAATSPVTVTFAANLTTFTCSGCKHIHTCRIPDGPYDHLDDVKTALDDAGALPGDWTIMSKGNVHSLLCGACSELVTGVLDGAE